MLTQVDKIKRIKTAGDSMARFDLLQVDEPNELGQWARYYYKRQIFFSKNCANTETHSFDDIHAIRILDSGNNHSLPAVL